MIGLVENPNRCPGQHESGRDDLFRNECGTVTVGIDRKVGNAILIKVNQIGSLSETIDTIELAQQHHYTVVVSIALARPKIPDCRFAVAVNAEYIKPIIITQ